MDNIVITPLVIRLLDDKSAKYKIQFAIKNKISKQIEEVRISGASYEDKLDRLYHLLSDYIVHPWAVNIYTRIALNCITEDLLHNCNTYYKLFLATDWLVSYLSSTEKAGLQEDKIVYISNMIDYYLIIATEDYRDFLIGYIERVIAINGVTENKFLTCNSNCDIMSIFSNNLYKFYLEIRNEKVRNAINDVVHICAVLVGSMMKNYVKSQRNEGMELVIQDKDNWQISMIKDSVDFCPICGATPTDELYVDENYSYLHKTNKCKKLRCSKVVVIREGKEIPFSWREERLRKVIALTNDLSNFIMNVPILLKKYNIPNSIIISGCVENRKLLFREVARKIALCIPEHLWKEFFSDKVKLEEICDMLKSYLDIVTNKWIEVGDKQVKEYFDEIIVDTYFRHFWINNKANTYKNFDGDRIHLSKLVKDMKLFDLLVKDTMAYLAKPNKEFINSSPIKRYFPK